MSEYQFDLSNIFGRRKSTTSSPLSAEHQARAEQIARWWRYYRGEHNRPLKRRAGRPDHNTIENWAGYIVNTGVDFLLAGGVAFEADDNESSTRADAVLKESWERVLLRSPAFFYELAQTGGVTGAAFVRLYPGPDGVDVRIVDSALVDIVTEPDDVEIVTKYVIIWQSGDVWKRDTINRMANAWEIVREVSDDGKAWRLDADNSSEWQYPFPPLIHCKNMPLAHSQWGMSDLEDTALNDAVNAISSDVRKTLYHFAHPTTVARGWTPKGNMTTAIGRLLPIPEGADVYNLEMQSDLTASREFRRELTEALMTLHGTPRLDPARVNVGALSGFALQVLYGPLLARTEKKRALYGGLLRQVSHAFMVLGGIAEPPPVKIIWGNPLPVNRTEQSKIFATLAQYGNVLAAARIAGYTRDEAADLAGGVVEL